MNLILHHLWKDVRLQRWPILLWFLVLGVVVLPDFLVFQASYPAARAMDDLRDSTVAFTLGLIMWPILIAKLIQSEPMTGSTSFWLTRPIPTWVGLLGQILFIVLIVVLPAYMPVVAHKMAFQTNAQEFWIEVAVWTVVQLIAGICVIWLATNTANLAHFAGWLALCVVAVVLSGILREEAGAGHGNPDLLVVIELLCIGLAGSLLLTHLNRTTKTGFYMGLGSLLFALAYFTFGFESSETWSTSGFPSTKLAHIDFEPDWLKTLTWRNSDSSHDKQAIAAYAILQPVHEDPGMRVWVTQIAAKFEVPGEPTITLPTGNGIASSGTFDARDTQLLQSQLPGIKLPFVPSEVTESYNTRIFELNPENFGLRNKTGNLQLDARGSVYSLTLLARIPVGDSQYSARIDRGFVRLAPLEGEDPTRIRLWVFNASLAGEVVCVLVDPKAATGKVLTSSQRSAANSNGDSLLGSTVEDSLFDFESKGKGLLDRDVLYVFQYAPVVEFETKLIAPEFKILPPD